MLYTLNEESIELIRRELAKPGGMKPVSMDHAFTVFPPSAAAEWHDWQPTRSVITTNDTLTLSAAHRLLGQLADDTLSRETLAECRDVMSQLERMVEKG